MCIGLVMIVKSIMQSDTFLKILGAAAGSVVTLLGILMTMTPLVLI